MNQLTKIFNGHELTIIDDKGEPKFLLKDVCNILDLGHVATVSRRLDKDVVSKHPLQTSGGMQRMSFVNEDGLYDVVLDSRKPEARRFRKWITSEVLPSIRKTGSYENKPMTIEEMIIAQAESVKEVKQEVQQIKQVVDNEVWVNERMKKQIQDTVSRRVFELRRKGHEAHFQTIYSSLKRYYGVSKYDKIPRKDFEEAIQFIQGWFPREKKQFQEV